MSDGLLNLIAATLAAVCFSPLAGAEAARPLIFGRASDSISLDPAGVTDGESLNVTGHIFDTLVTLKLGTTTVAPSLATKWEASDSGKTYTFHLVADAKFSDGTPVDADAVIFSFMRQLDKKHPAYAWGGPHGYVEALAFDKLIKDIVKVDSHTVSFHLNRPSAPFLASLSLPAMAIVSPAALTKAQKEFGQHPVGSGPYLLRLWEKKQKIVLVANPTYWGKKPAVTTVIFRAIPDNNTRLAEMLAGNLQVMDNPDTNTLATLSQKLGDRVQILKAPGFNVGYLVLNMDKKPLDQVLVRRAIAYAINKKAIVANVYNGYGVVAKNPLPPTLWGYNEQIKDYDYDPDKARELLKKAGLGNGFPTDLWAMPVARPYMPDGRKVAEAIQGDLAKVGITAKIVSYDWGTYLDKVAAGEHAMALTGWTGDIGDPDNFLYQMLDKDNAVKPALNASFYRSEPVHALLAAAQTETDHAKREKLYKQVQILVHDDVPIIPIAHSEDTVPISTRVHGFVLDPTGRRNFSETSFTN